MSSMNTVNPRNEQARPALTARDLFPELGKVDLALLRRLSFGAKESVYSLGKKVVLEDGTVIQGVSRATAHRRLRTSPSLVDGGYVQVVDQSVFPRTGLTKRTYAITLKGLTAAHLERPDLLPYTSFVKDGRLVNLGMTDKHLATACLKIWFQDLRTGPPRTGLSGQNDVQLSRQLSIGWRMEFNYYLLYSMLIESGSVFPSIKIIMYRWKLGREEADALARHLIESRHLARTKIWLDIAIHKLLREHDPDQASRVGFTVDTGSQLSYATARLLPDKVPALSERLAKGKTTIEPGDLLGPIELDTIPLL